MRRRTLGLVRTAVGLATSLYLLRSLAAKRFPAKNYRFAGKCVVITGGSRGMGLVMAREFLRRGARVALLARDQQEIDRALEDLRLLGSRNSGHDRVLGLQCDVTEENQVFEVIDRVREHFGSIDVLVNNAGKITVGPMQAMTPDDYRDSLNTHFWGAFYTTSAVLPEMRARRSGRIVNISSIGGKISVPHLLPYCVGKFALAGFSEGLRSELKSDNVVVSTIYPGLMRTGSPRNAFFKGKHRAEYTWFSLSDALPGLSINAERAARQIVDACQHGDARLIVSMPAKIAVKGNELFPSVSAALLGIANRLLPKNGGVRQKAIPGKDSSSPLSPSWATVLDDRAAVKNNEVA